LGKSNGPLVTHVASGFFASRCHALALKSKAHHGHPRVKKKRHPVFRGEFEKHRATGEQSKVENWLENSANRVPIKTAKTCFFVLLGATQRKWVKGPLI
jgi:hypothetical protein